MTPTLDFLHEAEHRIRQLLEELRPQLLGAQGNIEHHLKNDKSAVTEMDVMVENRLRDMLAQLDPAIGFAGEETGADLEQKTFWLVDPIDGTEPFIRGLPFATNMIALIDQGQPVFSIIYNFSLGDFYMAIKGKGATCNGHPIKVSNRTLDRAFICLARIRGEHAHKNASIMDQLQQKVIGLVKMRASGYEFACIASGALEARICFNPLGGPWDYAPGTLLIQEAGGRVGNIGASGYDYRNGNFIASNQVVFDELMEFMQAQLRDTEKPG
jgi:myo-inositol-1(or 4)-monophosphatase